MEQETELDISDLIKLSTDKYGIPDPIDFFASVMAGKDIRDASRSYTKAMELCQEANVKLDYYSTLKCYQIDRKCTDYLDVDPEDVADLINLILKEFHYKPVPMELSVRTGEKLIKLVYPDRKSIEHKIKDAPKPVVTPLTEKEITKFLRVFDEHY